VSEFDDHRIEPVLMPVFLSGRVALSRNCNIACRENGAHAKVCIGWIRDLDYEWHWQPSDQVNVMNL
jgi:hypothetical protein